MNFLVVLPLRFMTEIIQKIPVIKGGVTRDCIIYQRDVSLSIITKLRDEFRIIFPATFSRKVCSVFRAVGKQFSFHPPTIRIMNEIKVRRQVVRLAISRNILLRARERRAFNLPKFQNVPSLWRSFMDCRGHNGSRAECF